MRRKALVQMLRDIVETTIRAVDPERIILFGSYARGDARPDSDLDLLVVERGPFDRDKTRCSKIRRLRRALWDFPISMNILVYTENEVAEWQDSVNHVIARSLREGKILYKRDYARAI